MAVERQGSVICGIDPGLTGAVAFIGAIPAIVYDMPIVRVHSKGYVDGLVLRNWFVEHRPNLIVIEMQGVRPGQGISSSGQIMLGYGGIVSVALSMNCAVELVAAPSWKRKFGLLNKDKDACRLLMLKRFPELADGLRRKKDHGRADGLAIAEYGKSLSN